MLRRLILLEPLAGWAPAGLFILRAGTGVFLIHGVIDNMVDPARMEEFIAFMGHFGFPSPALLAPFSVYAQFAMGLALIAGLLTRWAGLMCALHFIIGLAMVHGAEDLRAQWPALALVLIGVQLGLSGAGPWSIDALLARNAINRDGATGR